MGIYSTRTEKDQVPLSTLVRRATGAAAGRRYTGVRLTGIRARSRETQRARDGGRIMIHDTGASSAAGKDVTVRLQRGPVRSKRFSESLLPQNIELG